MPPPTVNGTKTWLATRRTVARSIFRRSALDRLSTSSYFGSDETRRSSFTAPLAATEFSSSAASAG